MSDDMLQSLRTEAARTDVWWARGNATMYAGWGPAEFRSPGPEWSRREAPMECALAAQHALAILEQIGMLDGVVGWTGCTTPMSIDLSDGRRVHAWPHRAEIVAARAARADDRLWQAAALGMRGK